MLLTKLKVRNFLSVHGECELPIDSRVTVLLGANDHGKSNLLKALTHLNSDIPIREEHENWDSKGARLDFHFRLRETEVADFEKLREAWTMECQRLIDIENERNEQQSLLDSVDQAIEGEKEEEQTTSSSVRKPVPSVRTSQPQQLRAASAKPIAGRDYDDEEDEEVDETEKEEEEEKISESSEDLIARLNLLQAVMKSLPELTISREGVGKKLSVSGTLIDDLPSDLGNLLRGMIPRVEIFESFSAELQDSVKASEITKSEFEFLQGIFFYAGLDPMNSELLFKQDDETDKTLEEASVELDKELRRIWAQGVDLDLHFQLKHRGSSIELLAKDPAVKKRQTRMSKRSSGVTQFFRLSMVLHARRRKNPANSYIYVFDEPGVFLHPKGQKDLLAVFEQLGLDTQIVYATHSLFMLNQNFPERHRLISKNSESTKVDSKPYRANWRYAVDALGVRLTANILFSPNVLLVEGDSDPIYLYELFRTLNQLGQIDADANLIGIMSYGDLPNLRFLLQTFKADSGERPIAVLFEGDSRGREYQKQVASLCKKLEVKTLNLNAESAIEDYCLYSDIFLSAVETTIKGSLEAQGKPIPGDLPDQVRTSWTDFLARRTTSHSKGRRPIANPVNTGEIEEQANQISPSKDEASPRNAGAWFKQLSASISQADEASKVALARNYAFLSRDHDLSVGPSDERLQMAKPLIDQIVSSLKLPSLRAKQAIEGPPDS